MPDGLIYVMAGAVVVSALALVLQLLILYGLYVKSKSMSAEVQEVLPRVHRLLENAEVTLNQSRKQITDVTAKAGEVLELSHAQLSRVDASLGDVLIRMRGQLERAEGVIYDSLIKLHETVTTLHSGIVKPLREVSGIAAGIRATVRSLTGNRHSTPPEVTQDDEMFI